MHFFGLFVLIFNKKGNLQSHHVLVSTYSSVYDLELHYGWEQFEEYIVNAKWKGNLNPNMTSSIDDVFKRLANEERDQRTELYEAIVKNDNEKIDSFLFDILSRVIRDKNMLMETAIQIIAESEFDDAKNGNSEAEFHSVSEDPGTEAGSVTLPIRLILAPVSGKPIYELKLGDKIMVKIKPDTDRANYIIDQLELRLEDHIKPVPGKVIDIKSEGRGDPVEILLEIAQGVYGHCLEDEKQVKLRLYDSRVDNAVSTGEAAGVKGADVKGNSGIAALKPPVAVETGPSKMTYILIGLFIMSVAVIAMALLLG